MKKILPSSLRCLLLSLGISLASFTNPASAATYYWDENDSTSGFGTAGNSGVNWTSSTSLFSTDSTGATSPSGTQATATADSVNFGTATAGLAAGTITLGAVSVGNLTFGAASGAITLSSGTLSMGAAQTTTVNNASDTIGSVLSSGTNFTKAGSGALNLSGGGSVGNLIVSNGSLNVTAGTLAATGAFSNLGNTASTTGIVSVSSGATLGWTGANGGNFGTASGASGVLYNAGIFNQSATTVNNAGIYIGNAANSYGYLRNSGTTTMGGRLWIAQAGNAAGATGMLDITGGSVSVNPTGNFTAGQRLQINGDNNSHTTSPSYAGVNVVSGTLVVGGNASQTNINTGQNEYTSINITGSGKFTAGNAGTDSGMGLSVTNIATNTATLSISNGGTLETSYIYNNNALGTGVITFDNGTIRSLFNNAQGLIQGANTKTYIQSGGATFDTNGFAATVPNPILAPTGNGLTSVTLGGTLAGYVGAPVVKITGGGGQGAAAIANFDPATGTVTGITITSAGSGYTSAPTITLVGGNGGSTGAGAGTATATATIGAVTGGGLTKTGAGALTLTGANTYSGGTTVSTGTLTANNSTGSATGTGAITVASGASLNGTGSVSGNATISGELSGSVAIGGDLSLNASSKMSGSHTLGGNVALNNDTLANVTSNITLAAGKTLSGNGGTQGSVTATAAGSIVAPGNSGVGNLSMASLSIATGAHLSLDILGTATGNYDTLAVSNSISLSGGDLTLTLGSFTPGVETLFLAINSLGGVNGTTGTTGSFSSITFAGNGIGSLVSGSGEEGTQLNINGTEYTLTYSANYEGNSVTGGNDVALVAAVPEPGTWAMLVGGLGMLVSLQRSRRRN